MLQIYPEVPTITVSASTRDELVRDFSYRDITVLSPCYAGKISAEPRTHAKDITYIGRLTRAKGVEDAIRAFASAERYLPEGSELHIIG